MKPILPGRKGFAADRLARLDEVMQGYIERGQLAGITLLVARRGRVALAAEFGFMDVAAARPMAPDTIFRIASMTKPITSVAAMILFEREKFLLTEPISAYLPEFKEVKIFTGGTAAEPQLAGPSREITFWHLLTHTSGLGYPESNHPALAALYRAAGLNDSPSLADLSRKLARLPLFVDPGSRWQYGFSHDVLARLVEILSGRSFDDFLQQEIFDPLGMEETGFFLPEEEIGRLATVYGPGTGGGLEIVTSPTAGDAAPPGFTPGGHGLFSTAPDYLRFARLLLNGGELDGRRLLSRKTVELMTANHLPAGLLPFGFAPDEPVAGHGYGLGVGVIMDPVADRLPGSAGSYYWTGAYDTMFWIDPREALIGIFMAQYQPSGVVPARKQFRALVYQALVD